MLEDKINRLLGRGLTCGERSWYQKIWDYRIHAGYDFKTKVLRRDWYVEARPMKEADQDYYNFRDALSHKQAQKIAFEWMANAIQHKVSIDIWAEQDRPGNTRPGIDIQLRYE